MTTVYLIRHAEPDNTIHDDMTRPLTQAGRENSKRVTNYLWDKQIDTLLSSPYIRAVDTIKDFADSCKKSIKTVYDFRERAVDRQWITNFTEFFEKQWQDFSYKLKEGECLQEVQDRNITSLKIALSKYQGKNIVIGSHGTAISTIINFYDKSFGLEQFHEIKWLMPFVVKMDFNEQEFLSYEIIDIMKI